MESLLQSTTSHSLPHDQVPPYFYFPSETEVLSTEVPSSSIEGSTGELSPPRGFESDRLGWDANVSSSCLPYLSNSSEAILEELRRCHILQENLQKSQIFCSECDKNLWALLLLFFPIITVFGNVLVILAVAKERSLQSVTNYFIVSLAVADLLVGLLVMPLGAYYLVNVYWGLPPYICDCYIGMDVICSTSSIFNLVAISIDRYIAVTKPIRYAQHKNNNRIVFTIALVWLISIAIGIPIMAGLNDEGRTPGICAFNNAIFIISSSTFSFYIPCLIMIYLYYRIFKAIRERAKNQAMKRPKTVEVSGATIIENVAQTRKLAETNLGDARFSKSLTVPLSNIEEDRPTNNTSNSQEDDEDGEGAPPSPEDNCHVIRNPRTDDVVVVLQALNDDNREGDELMGEEGLTPPATESSTTTRNGTADRGVTIAQSNQRIELATKRTRFQIRQKLKTFTRGKGGAGVPPQLEVGPEGGALLAKKERKAAVARFTIYKAHKASKRKREKSSAKKERKATKTLAIVLGAFLVCWVPFFTCNILDAVHKILDYEALDPGATAFLFTTWLGYMNSFLNPVIYTIFNPEFRKAFKKLLTGKS